MSNLREAISSGCIRLCHALFMRAFTQEVTVLVPRGDSAAPSDLRERLGQSGIRLIDSQVCEVTMTAQGRAAVRLDDGSEHTFDTLYPVLGARCRAELALGMGRHNEMGELVVDHHHQTSVSGLYAAGDVVAALNQLSVATGHAAIAATAIHNSLGLKA